MVQFFFFFFRFVRIQDKLRKAVGSLDYFTQNEWFFAHKNLDSLLSKMTPEDRKVAMTLSNVHEHSISISDSGCLILQFWHCGIIIVCGGTVYIDFLGYPFPRINVPQLKNQPTYSSMMHSLESHKSNSYIHQFF